MNLVFDYDGTLHDCIRIYAPAFRRAWAHLVSLSLAQARAWEDREVSRWLGIRPGEMWDAFMPALPRDIKDECSRIIGDEMLRLTREGRARLYPQALRTLEQLKRSGHTLIFLSNCKRAYMLAHRECFRLDDYFAAFYCAEDFAGQAKHEIFGRVMKNSTGEFVVIGDRVHDMEIAQIYGLKAIGCGYGYGEPWELAKADFIAAGAGEILLYLASL